MEVQVRTCKGGKGRRGCGAEICYHRRNLAQRKEVYRQDTYREALSVPTTRNSL